jgi:beta-galactosidase GanA
MAIERAKSHKDGKNNLTWGTFISDSTAKEIATTKAEATKKEADTPAKAKATTTKKK